MPADLRKIVERAIGARQRCYEWFQKSEVRNEHADKTHFHFIEILKQCLQILEPCVQEDSVNDNPKECRPLQEESAGFANRFAALHVDESLDIDTAEDAEISASVKVAKSTKVPNLEPTVALYELDDEGEFDNDLAFIIFCNSHLTQL